MGHTEPPVEGQGHCLDTWICLACGFFGSDVFKQLAQPLFRVPNQAGRDNFVPRQQGASCRVPHVQPVSSMQDA